ncbi:quinoprotein relay system zinc metallohydrolase 2 [Methyloprofundus sp.]|uniref:quinoprotein relay system zinc metallohydrolase 2 n=1 Tax=Methyloprofundus sp. TaxID=2020875 RepID=UPI003D0E1F43
MSTVSVWAAFNIKQVALGIYVHQGLIELPDVHNHDAIANIGFIVGENCVAVIDSGGSPAEGEQLKQSIHKITSVPICYVINTHVHPDHIFGNSAFKNLPNIKFIGHKKLGRAMAERGPFYIARSKEQVGVSLTKDDIVAPTMTVENALELDLGGRIIILTAHPTAHTDNDLSVLDKETNTLWLSDLFFIGHLPVLDGSLKGWLVEINKLEKRQFEVVIPGHGPIVRDWPESMQPEKKYLQYLATVIRSKIKQGVFMEDVLQIVSYPDKQQWQLFDDFHKKNLSSAYAELEWED